MDITDRRIDRQTNRWMDRQMERLTDRQTDRQICEMAATIIIKTRLKRLSVLKAC